MSKLTQKSLKICHLADTHLGYRRYNKLSSRGFNQREVDVSQAFREAIDRIILLAPDMVLIAGDIFHTVRPSNAVLTFTFREIKRLVIALNVPVIIIAGNHDTPKRIDSGSILKLFQEIDQVYVADYQTEKFDFPELELSVLAMPHLALENFTDKKKKIDIDTKYKYNILLTHAQVGNQFFSEIGGANLNLNQLVIGEWDYIALGHIHVYQEVSDNVVYSGALEHTSNNIWGEADFNKGFVEVDLVSKEKRFYSLTSTREVISLATINVLNLDPDEVMDLINEQLNSVAGGIEGKIVRMEIENLTSATYALLDHKTLKKWRKEALQLVINYKPPTETVVNIQLESKASKPLLDNLLSFSKEKHIDQPVITQKLTEYIKKLEVADEVS